MIEPGSVFQVAPQLARPPQEAHRDDPAARQSRWVLVVSTERQCQAAAALTVFVVLLSEQVQYADEHDVLVLAGEGVVRDSIAQTDVVFTVSKLDLDRARYRGRVQADTLLKVRAALGRLLGFV